MTWLSGMIALLPPVLGWVLVAMVWAGVAYQLLAAWAVWRFFAQAPAPMTNSPAVTLLKPLHGAEPHLQANLASFLHQDYAGPVQMVLGVNHAGDAALPAARALAAAHPTASIALSTGPAPVCANGKVGNLVAMAPLATHDILILSDSDMVVGPDYLATVVAALMQPNVGIVSCAFVGRGDTGLWSQLGAAMIGFQGMPNVVFAAHHGLERPCMGATIAIRRETLHAIGGFEALADVLADDYAMGERVAALGLTVAIPPLLITHAGTEASAGELWRHFLRWAVTIRDLKPAGHYGSIVTLCLPLALLAAPFAGPGLALAALAARAGVAITMRRAARAPCAPLWLLPLGDIFGFAVFCASLFARHVDWRGASLTIKAKGRIAPANPPAIKRAQ